ncbi:MAG: hypothetical protein BWY75_03838 [bacterium ADurb.Bin425]|nr:MAG: hypothetical protein BWY75_03838 [bacterium ADurb.Bin425]
MVTKTWQFLRFKLELLSPIFRSRPRTRTSASSFLKRVECLILKSRSDSISISPSTSIRSRPFRSSNCVTVSPSLKLAVPTAISIGRDIEVFVLLFFFCKSISLGTESVELPSAYRAKEFSPDCHSKLLRWAFPSFKLKSRVPNLSNATGPIKPSSSKSKRLE